MALIGVGPQLMTSVNSINESNARISVAKRCSPVALLFAITSLCDGNSSAKLRTTCISLVASWFDHCSALCMGLLSNTTQKLQLVQKATETAVMGILQHVNARPLLCKLHCFPACFRVRFVEWHGAPLPDSTDLFWCQSRWFTLAELVCFGFL